MDLHAVEYYRAYAEPGPHAHFHKVIALHDDPLMNWSTVQQLAPRICRGWYELAQLSVQDRIEFTRDFWLAKFSYHPNLTELILKFFSSLDDVGIFLTQQRHDDPFIAHLVYSLSDNSGFFHGESPASESEIIHLQKEFPNTILPPDYLTFLQIHNGFAKLTDTGITSSIRMRESYEIFQSMLVEDDEPITTKNGASVNPASLIPFYESFGMPFYQCFWADWYPDQEMGNVYFSADMKQICTCEKKEDCAENLAFQSFIDWLMFYLEKID